MQTNPPRLKKAISLEPFAFLLALIAVFWLFCARMGFVA